MKWLEWTKAKYPPKWPFVVGMPIQLVGYGFFVAGFFNWPLFFVAAALIYGGGLIYGAPFFLWMLTPRD